MELVKFTYILIQDTKQLFYLYISTKGIIINSWKSKPPLFEIFQE